MVSKSVEMEDFRLLLTIWQGPRNVAKDNVLSWSSCRIGRFGWSSIFEFHSFHLVLFLFADALRHFFWNFLVFEYFTFRHAGNPRWWLSQLQKVRMMLIVANCAGRS